MYFVIYLIAGIILFVFLLLNLLNIVFDTDGYKSPYYHVYAILLFLVMIATFANIIIAIFSYRKTINIAGLPGDRGIKGNQGKVGKTGVCKEKCGQQVCYVNLIDKANEVFKEEVSKLLTSEVSITKTIGGTQETKGLNVKTKIPKKDIMIKNTFFIQTLNSICKSDQYQSIMLGKHPSKPSEKKLIEYLESIIGEWVRILIDTKYNGGIRVDFIDEETFGNDTMYLEEANIGVRFLLERDWNESQLNYDVNGQENPGNPFKDEIKKYDIWNWSQGLVITPLNKEIVINDIERPEPDEARLYIEKSNNYDYVWDTSAPKDLWDDSKCKYGEMGADRTNPQNLSKCVFLNDNYLKDYSNTWKTDVYLKDKEVSLYNTKSYKNKNNQIFYPTGSVWRGIEKKEKPDGATIYPFSRNSCGAGHGSDGNQGVSNEGPEKQTVLVSGDVKKPKTFELIWNNKVGCNDCQANTLNVYRPIPEEGYKCLGDYVTREPIDLKDNADLILHRDKIRCLPKDCLEEMPLKTNFWNNKNISHDKYDTYEKYVAKTPRSSDTQLTASFWTAGIDAQGSAEEQKNNYGMDFEDDDGYNLFRVGKGLRKPRDQKAYKIKNKCLRIGGGKEPKHPEISISEILENREQGSVQYKTSEYFDNKPGAAILTNKDQSSRTDNSILNYENKPIRLYLLDDNYGRKKGTSKRSCDTYFLATFNPEKNDFSNYIVCSKHGDPEVTDNVSKNNKYHRWVVTTDVSRNFLGVNGQESQIHENVHIISYGHWVKDGTIKSLKHYYDSRSIGKFTFGSSSGSGSWQYKSFVPTSLPKFTKD